MKKIFAAVMLAIYLFNIGGQIIVRQYFVYLADNFFNEQIAKGKYNVNDLTEVKIPVNMPAIADWKGYENISGQIQFENTSYNYVKMRMTRNFMYLMCVPNYRTTHLSDQNIIAAKQVKDAPVSKKNHVPYAKKMLMSKFSFAFIHFQFCVPVVKSFTKIIVLPVQRLYYRSPDIPEQPPRQSC